MQQTVQRGLNLLMHKIQMHIRRFTPNMTHFSVSFDMIRTKLVCNTYTNHLQTILKHEFNTRDGDKELKTGLF